jgi:hypothetical protein
MRITLVRDASVAWGDATPMPDKRPAMLHDCTRLGRKCITIFDGKACTTKEI